MVRMSEHNRPKEMQSESHLASYRLKIAAALDRLENEGITAANPLDIGHIAIGCALAHLDFRYAAEDWRAGRPKLSGWYATFAARPSMRATEYVDAY